MSWGTLLPRHMRWSYYHDPRCLRGSSSNLAMICVPNVTILALFFESIPWCHLVVGILLLGSWTRDSPYLLHVDSVASSFRILVTFAIVLEVRGISFFQIPWTILGRSSFEPKDHNQSALDEFSILYRESASSTFCMGYPEEMLSFARHTNLCIHNSERYMFLWLSLFSRIPTFVYQLIARSNHAFVL